MGGKIPEVMKRAWQFVDSAGCQFRGDGLVVCYNFCADKLDYDISQSSSCSPRKYLKGLTVSIQCSSRRLCVIGVIGAKSAFNTD